MVLFDILYRVLCVSQISLIFRKDIAVHVSTNLSLGGSFKSSNQLTCVWRAPTNMQVICINTPMIKLEITIYS